MKRICLAVLLLAALLSTSCLIRVNEKAINEKAAAGVSANGILLTRAYPVGSPVRTYRVVGSTDFTFVQKDTEPYLEVTASENILPYFKYDLNDDGLLVCYFSSDSIASFRLGYVNLVLYAPDLEKLEIVGSGDANIAELCREGDFSASISGSGDLRIDRLSCDDLSLRIAGSGDMSIGVDSRGLIEAAIAGSGDIRLSGSADRAAFSVAGSGDIDATGLKVANDVLTSTKGSGDIRVR